MTSRNNPELKNAVTFGRYNTTTIAHIHTIDTIASEFEGVSVGVIDSDLATRQEDPPEEFRDFYDLADLQHTKTTFSIAERKKLLELSIADKNLTDTVSVVTIARPEYSVEDFTDLFPPDEHQLVFPRPKEGQTAEFDSLRDTTLSRILGRTTVHLTVNLTLHTSDIRTATSGHPGEWRSYMTPSAYEYFREIDGPARISL